jgi:uncharacterized DUF497 family protein
MSLEFEWDAGKADANARKHTSDEIMKKAPKPVADADDLRAEYAFDQRRARPNRFASRTSDSAVVVVLEPDVAKVFTNAESVNRLLRSVISAIPSPRPQSATRKPRRKAG